MDVWAVSLLSMTMLLLAVDTFVFAAMSSSSSHTGATIFIASLRSFGRALCLSRRRLTVVCVCVSSFRLRNACVRARARVCGAVVGVSHN